MQEKPWKPNDSFQIPSRELPSWRTSFAVQNGVANNILLRTWGGIGDQVCAEPAIRFALKFFKGCEITLMSEVPEIFSHLKFKDVYDANVETPVFDDYLEFKTNSNASVWNLQYQFLCHNVCQCVDFASMSAFRCQLPVAERNVVLQPPTPTNTTILELVESGGDFVAIHAGKHWQSKTFPVWWWDRVIDSIIAVGLTPVLLGKEIADHQGTVNTKTKGCIDLRNKTSLNETIWLLQRLPVCVCNDSSVLHMAVTGNSFIGFIATAKHQDFITHWRKNLAGVNEWSWRMQNFSKGGIWDLMDFCPNVEEEKTMDKVDPKILLEWLPEPEIFGDWCVARVNEYFS